MRHVITFFLLFCLFSPLFAQNGWDLFPLNQKMYWKLDGALRWYYNDSTALAPNGHVIHLFGEKYLTESSGSFFKAATTDVFPVAYENQPHDPWMSDATSWYFRSSTGDTLRFYQNAMPGDAWVMPVKTQPDVGALRIVCETLADEQVLGQTREVKTYRLIPLQNGQPVSAHALYNFNIKLAKGLGLTRLVQLQTFFQGKIPLPMDLVGWKNATEQRGFVPNFEDIFNRWKAGDVQKWHYWDGSLPNSLATGEWWQYDSITAVIQHPDSIVRVSDRVTLTRKRNWSLPGVHIDTTITFQYGVRTQIERRKYAPIIETPPGWFFLEGGKLPPGATVVSGIIFTGAIPSPTTAGHWLYSTGYSSASYEYNPATQKWVKKPQIDGENSVSYYDSQLGFLGYSGQGFYPYELKLIGYRQGSETNGDISVPKFTSGVLSPEVQLLNLALSPNPVGPELHIHLEGAADEACLMQVFNASGALVLEEKWPTASGTLTTDAWPTGVYLAVLHTGQGLARGRFVKW